MSVNEREAATQTCRQAGRPRVMEGGADGLAGLFVLAVWLCGGWCVSWEELIEPSDFFIRYNRYLAVDMWADSPQHEAQWFGLVESRLRLLVQVGRAGRQRHRQTACCCFGTNV